MSVAGGLALAFDRLDAVGGESLQIFSANQRQWKSRPVEAEAARLFREARAAHGSPPLAVHGGYLINLAGPDQDETGANRSVAAFADELVRSASLGADFVVIHPGSSLGNGIDAGLARLAANLDRAIELAGEHGTGPLILLETTAGQGDGLGSRFEHLARVIAGSRHAERLGVCLDTAHALAAGHDLRDAASVGRVLDELDAAVGLDRLKMLHLNDSKIPLGGQRDRHEHIGRGHIGLEGFRAILNHPALAGLPMTLETPKDKGEFGVDSDRENLATLRSLLSGSGMTAP